MSKNISKKTLVLNDEPLLHLALSLILDKIPNVVHLSTAAELSAQLSPEVGCVVIDRAAKGVELGKIAAELAKKSPHAGLVVLGKKTDLPGIPEPQLLFTDQLHSQKDQIAAWISRYSR